MNAEKLRRLVNETGIERLLGGIPSRLPLLSDVEDDALPEAGAVVRVDKLGLETDAGQLWAVVTEDEIHLIRSGSGLTSGNAVPDRVPDASVLVDEITRLLPIGHMPQAAHARAVLTLSDAEDVYDQLSGPSAYTASLFLVSDGLAQEEAEAAFDTMRTASIAARISFMALRGDELNLTYGIWIGQDGDDIWMASVAPVESSDFTLETVTQGVFSRRLAEGIASLGLSS